MRYNTTHSFYFLSFFLVLSLTLACSTQDSSEKNSSENSEQDSSEEYVYESYVNDLYSYSVSFPAMLVPQGESDARDGQAFLTQKDNSIDMRVFAQWNVFEQSFEEFIDENVPDKTQLIEEKKGKNRLFLIRKMGPEKYEISYRRYVPKRDAFYTLIMTIIDTKLEDMKTIFKHSQESLDASLTDSPADSETSML